MTQRERMIKTLNHELPDRIPTTISARNEVIRALCRHFDDDISGVYKRLGIETGASISFGIRFNPDFDEKVNGVLTGDCPYAGGRFIFHSEDTFEDRWGVVRRKGRDGKYVEWVSGPLVNAKSPDEYDFPGPECIVDDPEAAERVKRYKEAGKFVSGGIEMPFKRAWQLRGLQNFLMDYAANPDFVERLYDKIYELDVEIVRRLAKAGVDMITIGGDIAMHDRLFVRPDMWRSIDKPRLRYLISEAKRIKPDLHVFIHSDGNLSEIMPDLIEIGFDVINPVQPECMNPAEIKRIYGDEITLHGTISVQKTLPFGTVDDVKREVMDRIEKCGYNGGLVLGPSNVIPYDTPVENVIALYETARDYDLSKLRMR